MQRLVHHRPSIQIPKDVGLVHPTKKSPQAIFVMSVEVIAQEDTANMEEVIVTVQDVHPQVNICKNLQERVMDTVFLPMNATLMQYCLLITEEMEMFVEIALLIK